VAKVAGFFIFPARNHTAGTTFLAAIVQQTFTTMAKAKTKSSRTGSKPKARSNRKPAATSRKTSSGRKPAENMDGSMLEEFFLNAVKDIYWAEKALIKALPKMQKSATTSELKKAFADHLQVTKKQIERLEQVFEKMGKKAQGKKCDAMQGLVEESESIMSETKEDSSTRDAALIIAAQKVEHYEIATYGGLVQLAKTLKKNDIARLLETTLNEEKSADELLTKIAERGGVNEEAAEEPKEKQTLKESILSVFSK
jgi:ferritin-like metal-binding protein YciE